MAFFFPQKQVMENAASEVVVLLWCHRAVTSTFSSSFAFCETIKVLFFFSIATSQKKMCSWKSKFSSYHFIFASLGKKINKYPRLCTLQHTVQ